MYKLNLKHCVKLIVIAPVPFCTYFFKLSFYYFHFFIQGTLSIVLWKELIIGTWYHTKQSSWPPKPLSGVLQSLKVSCDLLFPLVDTERYSGVDKLSALMQKKPLYTITNIKLIYTLPKYLQHHLNQKAWSNTNYERECHDQN